jgi:ubiquinone/menaquinone biosynthesis C-methylase UbiE
MKKETVSRYDSEKLAEIYYEGESPSRFIGHNRNKEFSIALSWLRRIKKNQKILDIGCSGGRYSFELAKRGGDVTGIDAAPKVIRWANEKRKRFNGLKLRFIQGDIENLPFKKESFDIVLCIELLHHLNDKELSNALLQINKVMKKDGLFIFDLKNKHNPILRLSYKKSLRSNPQFFLKARSIKEMEHLLRKTGFRILKREGVLSPAFLSPVIMYIVKKWK